MNIGLEEVEGVGSARCIPVWDGPGTVKVVIIDSNLGVADEALIQKVKEHILDNCSFEATLTVTTATIVTINIKAKIDGSKNEEEFKSKLKMNILKVLVLKKVMYLMH